MKHAYLAAISAAALLAAPAAQAWDLSYDVSLGGIQFEDDVDVDTLTAMAFGGEIIAEQVGAGGLTYSLAFRGEAYDGDFSGSNDHTRWYREISYAVTGPSLFTYVGLGQSEDDGDSDDLAPYVYGGVGRDFDGFGMPMTGQIGLVASDDEYGETIQYAAFIDVATAFELSGDLSATVGGSMLYGARWNDSDPSDGTVFIGELRLGLDYTPGDGPISYYAEVLRTDFHTTEESNSPYVDEFRIGMRYALGGTTRAALPNVGRWVSVSVNEIE